MKLLADLKCFHCGQLVAQLLRQASRSSRKPWLLIVDGVATPIKPKSQVRCLRCGGPTFIDEVEHVHGRTADYAGIHEARIVLQP